MANAGFGIVHAMVGLAFGIVARAIYLGGCWGITDFVMARKTQRKYGSPDNWRDMDD
jgi:hypothetical protein